MDLDTSLCVEEDERVYRPAEDSRLLLDAIDIRGASSLLDIGTGTGLIALHAARHVPTVATDINPHAVALCRSNAGRNGVSLEVIRTDLFRGLAGRFGVVAFNPPYLPVRSRGEWLDASWSGGRGGDEVALRFLREASRFVSGEGRIYLLLSSRNREAHRAAHARYAVEEVARARLFFEEIFVVRLERRVGPPPPSPHGARATYNYGPHLPSEAP